MFFLISRGNLEFAVISLFMLHYFFVIFNYMNIKSLAIIVKGCVQSKINNNTI